MRTGYSARLNGDFPGHPREGGGYKGDRMLGSLSEAARRKDPQPSAQAQANGSRLLNALAIGPPSEAAAVRWVLGLTARAC
jgi:hypothetical protein